MLNRGNSMKRKIFHFCLLGVILIAALSIFMSSNQELRNKPQMKLESSDTILQTSEWVGNGTAICTANNDQINLKLCSDGMGGAILVWQDYRTGSSWDIYAQRIDADGDIQWAANGVAICTANNTQQFPRICSDGVGGAIITWQDARSGVGNDIYAQRINATGAVQWTANGIPICTAGNTQQLPQICSDGVGGAIVAWIDYQSGLSYDIYAQRVNVTGTIQWAVNGIAICTADFTQSLTQICSDGVGGAILTWHDYRSGTTDANIYVQRIDASGTVQWAANGTAICTASFNQLASQICLDGTGGIILAWDDLRSGYYQIYAQRIDLTGAVQWAANGIAICTTSYTQQSPKLCRDGVGGVILTWQDQRSGDYDIYAQRIDATGTVQWAANGTAICTASYAQQSPQICSDGVGGAILMWQDQRSGDYDIYAQRIDAIGAMQWTVNGTTICTASYAQQSPQICSDGVGGAILSWRDSRNGINDDIYTQRVGPAGHSDFPKVSDWVDNGTAICTVSNAQYETTLCNDGAGGVILTWQDNRSGSTLDIYAQRVDLTGTAQWAANGIAICTAIDYQEKPILCSDGVGGVIITWQDQRNGNYDIYAQRIDATGSVLWAADGVPICTAKNDQLNPQICSDGMGGAILIWEDERSGDCDIYAQRIDAIGTIKWAVNGTAICTAIYSQQYPQICTDGAGGVIIIWQDGRSASETDLYAQRIDATGMVQWAANGSAVCTAYELQYFPQICSDGLGGAIITWQDYRDLIFNFNDIYAQRIDATGTVQWATNGTAICTESYYQTLPQICSDGVGGAIITWEDARSGAGGNVFAQRVDTTGTVQWTTNGIPICIAYQSQKLPQLCSDGMGGAILTWQDYRSDSNWDIYAQRISATGNVQWMTNGIVICTANNTQEYPQICSDGLGGAIVAWGDVRSGISDIYAQRVNSTGSTDFAIKAPFAVISNPDTWSSINSFNISWSNPTDASGIIGIYYKLDAPPTSNADGTYVAGASINNLIGIAVAGEGVHTIYLWLKDGAGNIDYSQYNTTTLYLDSSIITPIGFSATPNSWTSVNSFDIAWTNPSDLSGIVGAYYKLDASPTSNTDGTYVSGMDLANINGIIVAGEAAHIIYLWLEDGAGNLDYNQYNTTILCYDHSIAAPIGVSATPSTSTTINYFNITWTNPSDLSGIVGAYYKLDTAPTSNTDGTYVSGADLTALTGITVPEIGTHIIYIWLKDSAGNIDFMYNSVTTLTLSEKSKSIPFTGPLLIPILALVIILMLGSKFKRELDSRPRTNL